MLPTGKPKGQYKNKPPSEKGPTRRETQTQKERERQGEKVGVGEGKNMPEPGVFSSFVWQLN
jgi:hypothetical protein